MSSSGGAWRLAECSRPIIPSDKRAPNRRIVEALANEGYLLELDNPPDEGVWVYQNAAWVVSIAAHGITTG